MHAFMEAAKMVCSNEYWNCRGKYKTPQMV